MELVFVDVNVPMYAAGREHPLRDPARRAIRAVASGELNSVTDAEVLQEILYRYLHIGERQKGLQIFDQFQRIMAGRVLPIAAADVQHARLLAERHERLSARDLIHLAVMENHEIRRILTTDRAFDGIGGIERLDPADL